MKTKPLMLFLMILLCLLMFNACGDEADKTVADNSDASTGEVVSGETPADGKALLEERCTSCHDLDRVYAEELDEAGWNAVLDDMVSYGAELNPEERTTLVAYLASL